MDYFKLREELRDFYLNKVNDRARDFCGKVMEALDAQYTDGISSYEMKVMQYRMISEMFEPVIFDNSPFYYEMGTMSAQCDGARDFRDGHRHAAGWTFHKNYHLFQEQDEDLWELLRAQRNELLYLVGPYNDTNQHFVFNYRPVLAGGLKAVFDKAKAALDGDCTEEERQFLSAVCSGLVCIKHIAEKFADKAESMLDNAADEKSKMYLKRIAESAKRVPWEKPGSFYEALNTYAFLRVAVGALEGVGVNTFGRPDMDLYPFYKNDIESGRITQDEAYELIAQFLITWDMHYDHDMKMVGYSDHELENTYVLGGCDAEGKPLCNELTLMFLRANREEKIIYPKIKCRFSKDSPKEYLDEINRATIAGTSTVLYQNDDSSIPARLKAGRTLEEARDYIVSGCWDMNSYGVEKAEGGSYVNMLKAFEFSLHNRTDKMQEVGLSFKPVDGARDFEELYSITLENMEKLFYERVRVTNAGGQIWHKVDPLPIFSSTLASCIDKKRDFTAGGAKYNDLGYCCFGFPNIVDSLLVFKELCFDSGKYSLGDILNAVRNNWEGFEMMRAEAKRCHGWGDASEESCSLAARFNRDLHDICAKLPLKYGGRVLLGYLTYTEIRWWGEKTLATPDGRKNGEYISQGLTPSRLKKIPSVMDVIYSLSRLDGSLINFNSVVNVILPSDRVTLDICESFLRGAASSALQSLQLNCTTREQLLDAQKHPEKYPDLIVRVTGFSAKFTSLSPEWQEEILTRNFYQ